MCKGINPEVTILIVNSHSCYMVDNSYQSEIYWLAMIMISLTEYKLCLRNYSLKAVLPSPVVANHMWLLNPWDVESEFRWAEHVL